MTFEAPDRKASRAEIHVSLAVLIPGIPDRPGRWFPVGGAWSSSAGKVDVAWAGGRCALASVTLRPQGHLPVLQADLFDGSGHIQVVWLGRHRILGLVPGRGIRVTGRVGGHDPAHRAVFNPHYELLAPGPGR